MLSSKRARVAIVAAGLTLSALALHGGPVVAAAGPADARIRLRTGVVDPVSQVNVLVNAVPQGAPVARYIVQLDGPMTAARRRRLEQTGIELGDYVPDHAYVVRVDPGQVRQLARLGFVRWMGRYRDDWKVAPNIGTTTFQTRHRREVASRGLEHLIVLLFDGEDVDEAAAGLAARGAEVLLAHVVGGRSIVEVLAPAGRAADLAALDSVQFIEEASEATLRNDTNRWIVQSNVLNQTPVWNNGIHGEGQIGGLIDGRFKVSHCAFEDPAVPDPGPTHRKVIAYRGAIGTDLHGTHVAGTFVGDEAPYGIANQYDGIAFAAKLSFGDYLPVYYTPSTTYDAFEDAHNDGAHVHSNSWGDDLQSDYILRCQQIDEFMWDYEDDLVLFAVTNQATLWAPENAKNLVAVAACRDTPYQDDHCSGGEGPTQDGRLKPETMAPGCATESASAITTCGVRASTGTSMACPVVAGAALLTRQYFTDGFYPTGSADPADALIPSGALMKAVLINASVDMTGIVGYPSFQEGWGRVKLDDALYFPGDTAKLYVEDIRNTNGLSTGEAWPHAFEVVDGSVPLRVTLVWTDYPAAVYANPAYVNDLDLLLTVPGCAEYKGNVFSGGQSVTGGTHDFKNNLEQVHLLTPVPGTYSVMVKGAAVNQSKQGFALVITGGIADTDNDCNDNGLLDECEMLGGGDFDGDGVVDLDDFEALADCVAGPDVAPTPARTQCASVCLDVFDFDSDTDVDLCDFGSFQEAFNGG